MATDRRNESDISDLIEAETEVDWGPLLLTGVMVAIAGLVASISPLVTGLAVSILIGSLLLVVGVLQLVGAFRGQALRGRLWHLLLGGISLVVGAVLLFRPAAGLQTVTVLVIYYLLATGIVEVAIGLRRRNERYWAWSVASGGISVILAVMLWAGLPSTALWAVGLLIGIYLLVAGLSMVGIALAARRTPDATSSGTVGGSGGN